MTKEIAIYQSKNGAIEFDTDIKNDTIWATQRQVAELFGVDVRTVNEHLGNIFKTGELTETATIRKIRIVQTEGKRNVSREVNAYNLDAVLSVGYRVNSKRATDFRIWASGVLKDFMLRGVAINQKRLNDLDKVIEIIARSEISEVAGVAEVLQKYTGALEILSEYDDGKIKTTRGSVEKWQLTYESARKFLDGLEIAHHSGTFAKERNEHFEGIIAGLYQTFAGAELYKTTEEKAANLLYQVIKDHPFFDGNKRSAAALFVYFLDKNGILRGQNSEDLRVAPNALAAMTLMIALSKPSEKEIMIDLIKRLISLNDGNKKELGAI